MTDENGGILALSPKSPLIVPAKKVVASSWAIVPSGKVVTNEGVLGALGSSREGGYCNDHELESA
jgi:hypothetical protein